MTILKDATAARAAAGVPTERFGNPIADHVADLLAPYLGPRTSRMAVETSSLKALGHGPETLRLRDVPELQRALRPMLRTFVGREQSAIVLQQIRRDLGLY
jgi:hypothetical protein